MICSGSALYGENLIDLPAPGYGTVTGSSSHNLYPPANSFDDDITPGVAMGRWLPLQSNLPDVYLHYQFPAGTTHRATSYRLMSGHYNPSKRSPKSFTLQGSNDDSNWTNLDVVSGQTEWTADEWRSFTIDSPGDYQSYQLIISEAADTDTYLSIREFELLAPLELNTSSPLTLPENQLVGSSLGEINAHVNNSDIDLKYAIRVTAMESLIGWWRFDEGNGTMVSDSSDNDFFGIASKASVWSSFSPFHSGYSLDLSNNAYVSISDNLDESTFDGKSAFSVSFWGRRWPTASWGAYVSKYGENNRGWQIRRSSTSSRKIAFTLRGPGNDDWGANTSNIGESNWNHITATFGNGKRRLYQNGALIGQENRSGSIQGTGSKLIIGGSDHSNNANNGTNVRSQSNTSIDELRFYNRLITHEEVSSIYGGGLGDFGLFEIFQLDSNGSLRTKKSLDFESDDQNYTLPLRISHGGSFVDTNITVTLTNIVEDLDGDGIEDPHDPDVDGDGFSNQVELVNGSDPMDPNSFNRAPNQLIASTALLIQENQPIDSVVGNFSGTDPDFNSSLRFDLVRPAWKVSPLTGDGDSGVSSSFSYTCAVNMNGNSDKTVNGVTFRAQTGTTGPGWQIT